MLVNLQKEHPIIILNTSRTFGNGACIIAGFSHARGDAVVYMDSDLQDPPELIEKLLLFSGTCQRNGKKYFCWCGSRR